MGSNINKANKINWLLILQGWAMLWVVIGHAYLGKFGEGPKLEVEMCNIAYSFHMPLFMLVSGWLFYLTRLMPVCTNRGGQKWSYSAIIKDKALRLLLPGIVFTFVSFAIKVAFPDAVSRQTGFGIKEIVLAFLYPFDNPFREFWFIATLFVFFLFTPIWKQVIMKKWTMWLMLLVLIVLHFIKINTTILSIDRVCIHAVWFYSGIIISKEDYVNRVFNRSHWATLIIGIGLFYAGKYTNPFITTLGGIVSSFGLALIADRFLPKLFFSFRNYTYQIFLIGILAQLFMKMVFRHIPVPYLVAYILCIMMGVYVPILISKLIEKINWKPLSLCVGLKPIKK